MEINYYEIIKQFFDNTVQHDEGQNVKIDNESIEKLCSSLFNDFCLIDPFRNKKVLSDYEREKFCTEFNWFYNHLVFISLNNSTER